MSSAWKALAVVLLMTASFGPATSARAERFTAEDTDTSSMDLLDALADLQDVVATPNPYSCPYRFQATGLTLSWEQPCNGTTYRGSLQYRDYPRVETHPDMGFFNYRSRDNHRYGLSGIPWSNEQMSTAARAWIALGRERPAADPAADSPFQAALGSAPTIDAQAEQLRRVQVQVEAAMRGNRNIDAARLYRDALRTSPGWADGHYNLSLLYGDLELYPEAITEMRRYLYLTPNAADARAVQDKIYEWEAAMEAP